MAVTSPDSIYSPDPNTPYNYIVDMRAMANSTQAGINAVRTQLREELNSIVQDSGWVSAPLPTGFSGSAGYRRKVGQVSFRGTASTTSGVIPVGTFTTLFTLPPGFRPPTNVRYVTGGSPGSTLTAVMVQVTTDGLLQVGGMGSSAPGVYLSGFSYLSD